MPGPGDKKTDLTQKLNTAGKYADKGVKVAQTGMNVTDGLAGGLHNFFKAVKGDNTAQKEVGGDFARAAVPLAMSLIGATIAAVASSQTGASKTTIAQNTAKGALASQANGPLVDAVAAIVGIVSQPFVDVAVWITRQGNELLIKHKEFDLVSKLSGTTEKGVKVTQTGKQITDAAGEVHQNAKQVVRGIKDAIPPLEPSSPTMVKQFESNKERSATSASGAPVSPNEDKKPEHNKPKRPST